MVSLRAAHVDDPDAQELLTEYFAVRAGSFPGGGYRTVFPERAVFEPPSGVFVVLEDESGPFGCGGIRRLSPTRYEVKHLFVRDAGRGKGWGRLILEDLERRALDAEATELVLDTHHSLEAAGRLYARSGFEAIEPYNENPNATRWYRKQLA